MLEVLLDNSEFPRICPICGEITHKKLCIRDKVKTFSERTISGDFVKSLDEMNLLKNSEILSTSKLGYDLRTAMDLIKNKSRFIQETDIFFNSIEKVTKPKIMIFSRDHRNYSEIFLDAFEKFASDSGIESIVVDGFIPTTVSLYFGGLISKSEKSKVTVLHSTASHNPPNYNGIKISSGKFKGDIFEKELDFIKQIKSEVVLENYSNWVCLLNKFSNEVTFDLVNGAANLIMPRLAKKMYPRATFMNNQLLADFGGMKPEPKISVDWNGFGFAFDGDADRSAMYFKSKMVLFSKFLAGMTREGLFKDKKVVSDQRTPPQIVNYLESLGVKVIVGSIGRPNQQVIAQKENAMWFEENWHSGGYAVNDERFQWSEAPFAVAYWLDKLTIPIEKILKGDPKYEQK